MKKTIFLLILSFLAVSCYEEVVIPVGDVFVCRVCLNCCVYSRW